MAFLIGWIHVLLLRSVERTSRGSLAGSPPPFDCSEDAEGTTVLVQGRMHHPKTDKGRQFLPRFMPKP